MSRWVAVALGARAVAAEREGFKITGEYMSTNNPSSVGIQTEALPIASVPAWFDEVAPAGTYLIAVRCLSTHKGSVLV
jgi:hypothetical protein